MMLSSKKPSILAKWNCSVILMTLGIFHKSMEVTHDISTNHIAAQCTLLDSFSSTSCKICSNSWSIPETSLLMPSNLQIHRKVLLNNAKIVEETKIPLYKWLQKYDAISLKISNIIGHTDLIEMHRATRPDVDPVAAQPYYLALTHHDFSKQEIKNLLDAGIICKSMSPWTSPVAVVKNTHLKVCYSHCTCVSIIGSWTPCYW